MPTKIKFKKSVLAHCMHNIFSTYDINKLLCASVFLGVFSSPTVQAAEQVAKDASLLSTANTPEAIEQNKQALVKAAEQQGIPENKIAQIDEKIDALNKQKHVDSMAMLHQQEQNVGLGNEFKPIEFDDLENLPATVVDANLANEILRTAEQAKAEAESFRSGVSKAPEIVVADSNQAEINTITQAPVDVDQLMRNIESDQNISVASDEDANHLAEQPLSEEKPEEKQGFFTRIINKVRPSRMNQAAVPRITADVVGAPLDLANNIKAKLSSFTVESFSDFGSSVPQLRTLSTQAAQAVGYYDAEFKFEKVDDSKVRVIVTPNNPVIVRKENIEFTGPGAQLAQLQVIKVLPDINEGDILNHGKYELTKSRIAEAASNNGFFDAYWRLHDVKVERPENQADINLRYETGERYKLDAVQFRMSDPTKKLPIKEEILRTLAPWEAGADYTAWRVNVLANNLTNSRYFNYTLVDAVKPDPIEKPLELPPDLQALVDQDKVSASTLLNQDPANKPVQEPRDGTQNVADENQFAGVGERNIDVNARQAQIAQQQKETETDRLQALARQEKKIPVIVTLNADKLNSLEAGIGYGTDTGVRLRSQYRRAIVNENGHSFDANVELSQIRQSFDGRYNIPYKHPLNDYIAIVGGYEREQRNRVGNGLDLTVESAVLGADRIIKGARKEWQHIFGVRYRLDRVGADGGSSSIVNVKDLPDAFLAPGANTEQQSLLLGYEATKTNSDHRVNPTRGFKQNYKIQLGSESLLSDADMAIVNANWKFLYSLGENNDHQFVGGANLGYIFTEDFQKVPYNLRFFAGGDQSLRGFDYKSLSPQQSGFKVGGQALAIGSLEYNYQFKDGWRAAIFSDVGNAYDDKFNNKTEYGVGLGIRWASPIGPIRLDVASGISDPGHPIRLHFFIGPQL